MSVEAAPAHGLSLISVLQLGGDGEAEWAAPPFDASLGHRGSAERLTADLPLGTLLWIGR